MGATPHYDTYMCCVIYDLKKQWGAGKTTSRLIVVSQTILGMVSQIILGTYDLIEA